MKIIYLLQTINGPGNPKKKSTVKPIQPIDFLNNLQQEMSQRSYTASDNTRTRDLVLETEQRSQAEKLQKQRQQDEINSKTYTEIKPQSTNITAYASTNPSTRQIRDISYLNEQNPQTIYRPDMYYQGQYFSPETREQAKRDIVQYSGLLFGAADPMFLAYLGAAGTNEMFNDDETSKSQINTALTWAPWAWVKRQGRNVGRNVGNWLLKHTDEAAKTTEQTTEQVLNNANQEALNSSMRNAEQTTVTPSISSQYLAGTSDDAARWATLSVGRNENKLPYRITRKAKTTADAERIMGRSRFWGNLGRGSFTSDIFVPKNKIDDFTFIIVNKEGQWNKVSNINLFKPVTRASKSFKNSVGVNANPKDYYRVNLNTLLKTQSPAFTDDELRFVLKQQMQQSAIDAGKNAARMNIYYNPNTLHFNHHFWPIGYGNLSTGVPKLQKLRRAASSDLGIAAILDIPVIGGITYNKYIQQPKAFLHSGDYQENDQKGMLWYSDLPETDRQYIDQAFTNYKLSPDNDSKTVIDLLDQYYNTDEGYAAYKARRLRQ